MLQFAHSLLLVNGRYVLQLRDDRPDIAAPGLWALFGGSVEQGEEPRQAVLREVEEELCLRLDDCRLLWCVDQYSGFFRQIASYCFFEADITDLWGQHRLTEGQAVEHFSYHELGALRMASVMREAVERHYASLR